MIADGNLPIPTRLRAAPTAPARYVRVLLGPGREMSVPERAVRRWNAVAEEAAVVVEVDDYPSAARRQAAFMRFACALLQSAGVPDVTARLTEIAAALRRR